MSTIRTYARLKQLSYFIHIHTELDEDDDDHQEEEEEKKSSSINYVLCHNMNECQPVKETNGLRYASSSMSSFSSSSIDD